MATNGQTTNPTNNSSDTNANLNATNMRSTGAIPKQKPKGKLNNNIETKSSSSKNKTTNGLKSKNGHNLCGRFNQTDELWNGLEPGPSTSREVPFLPPAVVPKKKDSDSEYSSDADNDVSCSDECCIYTYKGDMADLPSSFMNMDVPETDGQESRAGSRGSSPEMDFLEMDFDPGPSCDADSDELSMNVEENLEPPIVEPPVEEIEPELMQLDGEPEVMEDEVVVVPERPQRPPHLVALENNLNQVNNIGLQADIRNNIDPAPIPIEVEETFKLILLGPYRSSFIRKLRETGHDRDNIFEEEVNADIKKETELNLKMLKEQQEKYESESKRFLSKFKSVNIPWIPKNIKHRTSFTTNLREGNGRHNSSGDLISPNENYPSTSSSDNCINTSASLYHSSMAKQLVFSKHATSPSEITVEKTMIYTEQEAVLKQVTQIGTSACGATAVLNVLNALNYPVPSNQELLQVVKTRQRANSASLVPYLKARSVAGTTHRHLIQGLHKLTNGQVYARFFHFYPEKYLNLSQWLSYWIHKGAVPIATLNLQRGIKHGTGLPDAWHHQMIFGVGPGGVYLSNPLERVEEGLLWHQLTSESVLLVRREDVMSHRTADFGKDLKELMAIKSERWQRLNVVGQVANVIREADKLSVSRTHVTIPAAYSAGITLCINASNPACETLKKSSELPLFTWRP